MEPLETKGEDGKRSQAGITQNCATGGTMAQSAGGWRRYYGAPAVGGARLL